MRAAIRKADVARWGNAVKVIGYVCVVAAVVAALFGVALQFRLAVVALLVFAIVAIVCCFAGLVMDVIEDFAEP